MVSVIGYLRLLFCRIVSWKDKIFKSTFTQFFSYSILYQDGLPELSMIVLKRIMSEQWLSFTLKLKRLNYGKKWGWEEDPLVWSNHKKINKLVQCYRVLYIKERR